VSHHLDSPASRQDPRLNLTDMYLFDGETGTVLIMVVNTSLAGAARIPGFHPEGRYEFKVHLDNEEYEDLTYRFVFGGSGGDAVQDVALYQLTGADARDDGGRGTLIAGGRTGEVINGPGGSGVRVWAGAAACGRTGEDEPARLTDRQLLERVTSRQARCAGTDVDPDAWFPVATRRQQARAEAAPALALCAACPMRAECLELSMRQWGEAGRHGVWGGLLDVERAAVRAQWLIGASVIRLLAREHEDRQAASG
jgi:hypothetical protein